MLLLRLQDQGKQPPECGVSAVKYTDFARFIIALSQQIRVTEVLQSALQDRYTNGKQYLSQARNKE